MSALTKLHDVIARVFDIGRKDAEEVVQAVTDHAAPILRQALTTADAEGRTLVDEIAKAVADEVAKLFGRNVPEAPAPAPAEPPAQG
ncbi:hypothetical protein ACWGCW_00925 [Streptomyces sp. NPDC054933]